MALLFCDGFDLYNLAATAANRGWSFTNSGIANSAASMVAGRYGGRALVLAGGASNGSGGLAARPFPSTPQTVVAAGAVNTPAVLGTAAQRIIRLMDSVTVQMSVQLEADGRLSVVRGATVLATSTLALAPAAWAWIEFKAKIDPAVGTYELRVDGVVWLTASGQNTRASANSFATGLTLCGLSNTASGPAGSLAFDDVIALDTTGTTLADFTGDMRIETLMPTGDVAVQWTPSGAGANAAQINEAQLSTANYVSSSTPGQVDTYTLANLSSVPATVHGVNVVWSASKSDAGARSARSHVVSGATTANGATKALGTGPLYYEDLFLTDPATAAAWDGAGVNAANLGLELVA